MTTVMAVLRSTVRIKINFQFAANPVVSDGVCARYRGSTHVALQFDVPFAQGFPQPTFRG